MENKESLDVLVVETDTKNFQEIKKSLQGLGCNVIGLKSHMQALTYFEDYNADIIIPTVMATDIDGFSFCSLIRNREKNLLQKYTYLILLAHENEKEDIYRSKILADDFILKPIDNFELQWRIKTAMNILKSIRFKSQYNAEFSQNCVLTRPQFFDFLREEFNRQIRKRGSITYLNIILPTFLWLQRDYGFQWSQGIEQCLLKEIGQGLRGYDRISRISLGQFCVMSRDMSLDELKGLSRRLELELQDTFQHCSRLKTESLDILIKGFSIELQRDNLPDINDFLDTLWHTIINDKMDEDIQGLPVTCFVLGDENVSSLDKN